MPSPYDPPAGKAEPEFEEPEHPEHEVADQSRPKPPIPPGDEFVTVYTTTSLMEAEAITAMLEGEGIATPGFTRVTGADIGVGFMVIDRPIRVPSSRIEEATQLIDEFLKQEPEPDEVSDDVPVEPRKSGFVKGVAWLALGLPVLLVLAMAVVSAIARLTQIMRR